MDIQPGVDGTLAVAFANTLVHDGSGGVADRFEDDAAVAAWVRDQPALPDGTPDPGLTAALRDLRPAARALFAHAVSPGPPSRADSGPRMPAAAALTALETAAARLAVRTEYELSAGRVVAVNRTGPGNSAEGSALLVPGLIALAVLDFLSGPLAVELRSCQAPRCVRYFVRTHGRQQWCKQSCATRARVARFEARRRDPARSS